MPGSKTIDKIYKESELSFLNHLDKAKGLKESQIHKLRVDIKNQRILLALVKKFPGKKKFKVKQTLKLLSPVFKKAGEIRTATLNLKLTEQYKSGLMLKFKAHLKQKIKTAEGELLNEIKDLKKKEFKGLSKNNSSILKKQKEKIVEQHVQKFLSDEILKAKSHLFEMNNNDSLHMARKKLKRVKNLEAILKELNSSKKTGASFKKIETTYEKIGSWHDSVVLAEKIKTFIETNKKIKPTLKAIKELEKLNEKNHNTRLTIMKNLRTELL